MNLPHKAVKVVSFDANFPGVLKEKIHQPGFTPTNSTPEVDTFNRHIAFKPQPASGSFTPLQRFDKTFKGNNYALLMRIRRKSIFLQLLYVALM
jgi:hypothetical protein